MEIPFFIKATGLIKRFGEIAAVDGASFEVHQGEFFGFLGPNGAGKTTTINMLTGLARPDAGEINVGGLDCTCNPKAAQHLIGVVPDESNLYPELSGFDNLCFCASLYGMGKDERRSRASELLETFGLREAADRKFAGYSRGMKRRLTIAAGIIHNPPVLFLDEPTTGIDVASARQIRQLVADLHRAGTPIFLTTHYIEEAERLLEHCATQQLCAAVVFHQPAGERKEEPMLLPASDQLLDRLIEEDVPYGDLTTEILGIGAMRGKIVFTTREATVVCPTEEAAGILKKFGAEIRHLVPSGEYLPEGTVFLEAEGNAATLHAGWRLSLSLLEHISGIATRTRRIVDIARRINPDISIAPTRKSYPGLKKLAIKAVECGGARPHRLGLSESVLIFRNHMVFLESFESLCAGIERLRREVPSMKLTIEVEDEGEAILAARAGFDIIQIDKMAIADFIEVIRKVRTVNPSVLIAAAGGITETNAAEYAATGAEILVLSSVFSGKTSDIGARIIPL